MYEVSLYAHEPGTTAVADKQGSRNTLKRRPRVETVVFGKVRPRDRLTACSLQCRNRRSRDLTLVPKFTSYKVSTSEGVDVEVLSGSKYISSSVSTEERVESTILPFYDFDLRASHPCTFSSRSIGFCVIWVCTCSSSSSSSTSSGPLCSMLLLVFLGGLLFTLLLCGRETVLQEPLMAKHVPC